MLFHYTAIPENLSEKHIDIILYDMATMAENKDIHEGVINAVNWSDAVNQLNIMHLQPIRIVETTQAKYSLHKKLSILQQRSKLIQKNIDLIQSPKQPEIPKKSIFAKLFSRKKPKPKS